MFRRTYIPGPPLSDFVEMFWLYDGPDPPHARERCLPTGTVEIVINLGGDRRNACRPRAFCGPLVCGAHSGFFVVNTADQASTMGVHFRPGGAFPFLGPAAELRDARVPLEALWGAEAARLRDRLLDAATVEARFDVLEQTLLARATKPLGRHPGVALALEQFRSRSRGPSTTQATTAPTCWTPTATTSRRSTTPFHPEAILTSASERS